MIKAIFATLDNGGFANGDRLPWPRLHGDMEFFYKNTKGHIVLMGAKTWNALPKRPLPERMNVVITSGRTQIVDRESCSVFSGEDKGGLLKQITSTYPKADIYIIGGVVTLLSYWEYIQQIYHTTVKVAGNADVFFPMELLKNNVSWYWGRDTDKCLFKKGVVCANI